MDAITFLEDLARAGRAMEKPMTIEEAVKIIDPNTKPEELNLPNAEVERQGIFIKACYIVCDYVREKLKEKSLNDDE